MICKLHVDDLSVTTFEVAAPDTSYLRYTPDCCTDEFSGCETGPETGCVDTINTTAALAR